MRKISGDRKIYNLKLDPELMKRLDHLKIDMGIPRQQLVNNCLQYVLNKIEKDDKIKQRISSPN